MSPPLTMAIAPGSLTTRILVHDGTMPLLKARLPHGPQHPRAALALAEALTLWTNRPCRVAVAAVGRGAFCATPRWLDALDWRADRPEHALVLSVDEKSQIQAHSG